MTRSPAESTGRVLHLPVPARATCSTTVHGTWHGDGSFRPGSTKPLADRTLAADRRHMPDSFGKRQRDQVKAQKAAARDERRVARAKRRKEGQAATPSVSRWNGAPEVSTADVTQPSPE